MRTRTRNLKRLLSLALCLCMVTGLLPVTALAADAPVITTESLAKATVGEEYTAALEAEASDPNGELIWSATGLPQWLTLTDNTDGTATLTGTPGEAGEVKFTVTVTETIPAAEPEEPAAQEAGSDGVTEPAGESQPTVLTASRTYTLTVAEAPANEPINEPAANAPLTNGDTDGGSARTTYQSVNATIYTGQGSYGEFTGETSTFAVDKAGLILDLRNFNTAVLSTWAVESIAFYPTDGTSEWGAVFWFNGNEEHPCDNGEPNNKLADGVFQILNFTPNGNSGSAELTPGSYKILVYVGNGLDYPHNEEILYLSNQTFTITDAEGPGKPVITTTTLPEATVGMSYEATLRANPATTGGSLSWALASDSSLPAGLALSTDGKITGTPTAAVSSHAFTVQVTEPNSPRRAGRNSP